MEYYKYIISLEFGKKKLELKGAETMAKICKKVFDIIGKAEAERRC
ncbi:MAG: hypothetical protein J7L14_00865 [Candidatus Diapherotrites archaeon]|nr:hypothetical protein [Candidatus Diapherotrites archaeon]